MRELYDEDFYKQRDARTRYSAKTIVNLVYEIIPAKSVCDVGCGVGTWLAAFEDLGATEILGLDGEWVDKDKLVIPQTSFRESDLRQPPSLDRTFDLAISLEVAEHLPEAEADKFVGFLASLAPVILFSAAIPGQTGIGHVNEQWPSYWVNLFAARGFVVKDCIRPHIWNDPELILCYQQNILVFVKRDQTELLSRVEEVLSYRTERAAQFGMFDLVHPKLLTRVVDASKRLEQKLIRKENALEETRHRLESLKVKQLSLRHSVRLVFKNFFGKLVRR